MPVNLLLPGALAAVAAAAVSTGRRARLRERRAEEDFPPTGRLLTVEGGRVHAHTEGEGPDLVLLHGASGNTREFTRGLMTRLKDRFRVTAFDRPGLGWSDRISDGTDPRAQARCLISAARQIGLVSPLVLGQSYGGAVAMAWALAAPRNTAGLILVSGAVLPWAGGLGAWYRLLENPLGQRLVIPLVAAYASRGRIRQAIDGIFTPDPVPEDYAENAGVPLTLRRAILRENAAQVNGLLPHIRDMSERYDRLTLPIEIVHGTADTIVPLAVHAEPLAARLPSARLTRIEGAGHMPHHAHPDAVIAAVDRAAARARRNPEPVPALR